MITNSELAQRISALVDGVRLRDLQFSEWLAGTETGGPTSNGEYPLTDYLGSTIMVPSPAKMSDFVTDVVAGAQGYAVAAAASAVAAASSATLSGTNKTAAELAETHAETAQASAEAARDEAFNSENNANTHRIAAAASATSAAASAVASSDSAVESEASAVAADVSADAAAASAAAAAASAAAAATFDPANFYTKTQADARYSQLGHTHTTSDISNLSSYTGFDSRYYTESEINSTLTGYALLTGATFTGNVTVDNIFVQVGKATSGQGGNFRMKDDGGTLRWVTGILGSAGARDYVIYDNAAGAIRMSVNSSSGDFTFNRNLLLVSDQPNLYMYESDAAVNAKRWRFVASSGLLIFQTRSDDDSSGNSWLVLTRSGTTVTALDLTSDSVSTSSALTVGTAITINGGGGSVSLKPGASSDHVYLQFFARSSSPGTRSGYFGFPSAGGTSIALANEISGGGINFTTTGGGGLAFNGNAVITNADVSTSGGASKILKTASDGYLMLGNWILMGSNTGLYAGTGHHFYNTGSGSAGWILQSGGTTCYIQARNSSGTSQGYLDFEGAAGNGILNGAGSWQVRAMADYTAIYTSSGYLNIGPQNTSFCHLTTDRAQFYFNKTLVVDGVVQKYGGSGNGFGNITLTTTSGTPSGGADGDFVFVY